MTGLKSKEGGYDRTGSRTPMQWDKSANAGFSSADAGDLYLPVNTDPDTPDVETQMHEPDSLWRHVQDLISFRREHTALSSSSGLRFLSNGNGYPLRRFVSGNDSERRQIVGVIYDKTLVVVGKQL